MPLNHSFANPYPHLLHTDLVKEDFSRLGPAKIIDFLNDNVRRTEELVLAKSKANHQVLTNLTVRYPWVSQVKEYKRLLLEASNLMQMAQVGSRKIPVIDYSPAAAPAKESAPQTRQPEDESVEEALSETSVHQVSENSKPKKKRRTKQEMQDLRAQGLAPPLKKSKNDLGSTPRPSISEAKSSLESDQSVTVPEEATMVESTSEAQDNASRSDSSTKKVQFQRTERSASLSSSSSNDSTSSASSEPSYAKLRAQTEDEPSAASEFPGIPAETSEHQGSALSVGQLPAKEGSGQSAPLEPSTIASAPSASDTESVEGQKVARAEADSKGLFEKVAFPHAHSPSGQTQETAEAASVPTPSLKQAELNLKSAQKSARKAKRQEKRRLSMATAEKLERARKRRDSFDQKATPTPGHARSEDLVDPPSQHGPELTQGTPTPAIKPQKKKKAKIIKDSQDVNAEQPVSVKKKKKQSKADVSE